MSGGCGRWVVEVGGSGWCRSGEGVEVSVELEAVVARGLVSEVVEESLELEEVLEWEESEELCREAGAMEEVSDALRILVRVGRVRLHWVGPVEWICVSVVRKVRGVHEHWCIHIAISLTIHVTVVCWVVKGYCRCIRVVCRWRLEEGDCGGC